nr:MAG TPA: hypothetical protein [Caudoviricetes sp.]
MHFFALLCFHFRANESAANRYDAPLFLRKSHQRFSLPFLRLASLCTATAQQFTA